VELSGLISLIEMRRQVAQRPIVVGISGYGGSGKSTLARQIVVRLSGAVRMRGDDFLDPARSHKRSPDWDGVERSRLVSEVLEPVRQGRPGTFRRYDWGRKELGAPEPLPFAEVLTVDLIGLFHPEALSVIDIAIWCGVDLEMSTQRGMARDAELGRDNGALWREVWVPNERDFEEQFAPRARADILYTASQ
jgi:uridine kinase